MKKQLFILSIILVAVFSFAVAVNAGDEMYSDKAVKSLFTKKTAEKPSNLTHFTQKQKACAPAACAACPSKCAPAAEAKVETKTACCGIPGCNCGCKAKSDCGVKCLTPCAAACSAANTGSESGLKSACKCGMAECKCSCEPGIKCPCGTEIKNDNDKKSHSKKIKKNWNHKKHLKKGKFNKNCPECKKLEVKPVETIENIEKK